MVVGCNQKNRKLSPGSTCQFAISYIREIKPNVKTLPAKTTTDLVNLELLLKNTSTPSNLHPVVTCHCPI